MESDPAAHRARPESPNHGSTPGGIRRRSQQAAIRQTDSPDPPRSGRHAGRDRRSNVSPTHIRPIRHPRRRRRQPRLHLTRLGSTAFGQSAQTQSCHDPPLGSAAQAKPRAPRPQRRLPPVDTATGEQSRPRGHDRQPVRTPQVQRCCGDVTNDRPSQLAHRRHPGDRHQRRVRCADPHPSPHLDDPNVTTSRMANVADWTPRIRARGPLGPRRAGRFPRPRPPVPIPGRLDESPLGPGRGRSGGGSGSGSGQRSGTLGCAISHVTSVPPGQKVKALMDAGEVVGVSDQPHSPVADVHNAVIPGCAQVDDQSGQRGHRRWLRRRPELPVRLGQSGGDITTAAPRAAPRLTAGSAGAPGCGRGRRV